MYFNYIGFQVTCSALHYIQCTSISLNQLNELIAVTIFLLNKARGNLDIQFGKAKRMQSTGVSEYDPDAHPEKSKAVYTLTQRDYM